MGAAWRTVQKGARDLTDAAIVVCIAVVVAAFVAEFADSALGMGYGTILAPVLIMLGFDPIRVVQGVLASELVTGLLAGASHHAFGNVRFWNRGSTRALRVAALLAGAGAFGTVAAVLIAVSIPKMWLKLYIATLVLGIGATILTTMRKSFRFSWAKVGILGLVASFNKGMSGGGYGPLVTGGQFLAGVEGKGTVGITSLAEGATCAVALATFALTRGGLDLSLALWFLAGAVPAVPLAAWAVGKIDARRMRLVVGVATAILGATMLAQTLLK